MREVSKLVIAEDKDHSFHLLKHGKGVGLYKVVFPVGIFVIAEDEKAAISQAECILRENPVGYKNTNPTAERIPCGIRGWSGTTF